MSEAMSEALPKAARLAGVTIPLFSLRTNESWGIGEIGDLPELARWLHEAGIRLVQILPLGEISGGETSPYAALTAFGIDPMYISLSHLPELDGDAARSLGGPSGALLLARARAGRTVDYEAVRTAKRQALQAAFAHFIDHELAESSPRAAALQAFRTQHAAWLDDYALFRALKDAHGGVAWWDWAEPLRERDAAALTRAREQFARDILYYEYVQWVAHGQWGSARAELRAAGVEVMGDLPFMVGRDSSDVWANQAEFRDDASTGVPPDAFDEDGQEWGLPPYAWNVMRANDFAWLRRRARYTGSLYDRFRIDHLVGFYRTYMRPRATLRTAAGKLVLGVFDPETEAAQLAHGEAVVSAMVEAALEGGARLIAEDLGSVPDYVRKSLTRLGVPGYKVLIWEKDGSVFRDPRTYAATSVACFGTHDTDTVAVWWETRTKEERDAVKKLPLLLPLAKDLGEKFTPLVHRALFDLLNASGSELVLYLLQDVLGTRERINQPGTQGDQNWTYRLPETIEELRRDPHTIAAMASVKASIAASGRGPRGPATHP